MLKLNLCDYSDAHILAKGNVIVVGKGNGTAAIAADSNNKKVNNYTKTSASLWQYCGDEPNKYITNSGPFRFKSRLINNIGNDDTANVKIPVPLK